MQSFGIHGGLPLILQTEAAECGLACLAMIAGYHGHQIDIGTLRRRYPISLKGATLRSLINVAKDLHFSCRSLRLEPDHLHGSLSRRPRRRPADSGGGAPAGHQLRRAALRAVDRPDAKSGFVLPVCA